LMPTCGGWKGEKPADSKKTKGRTKRKRGAGGFLLKGKNRRDRGGTQLEK